MLKNRLIQLRKETKLRQEDFAKKIGVARTTYAMYEQGRRQPDYEILKRIANFHNVTIDFLLGRSNDPELTQKEETHMKSSIKEWNEYLESLPPEEKEAAEKQLSDFADYLMEKIKKERGEK